MHPQPPPVDPGNGLLSEQPAQLTCTKASTPLGDRMVLTIRTTSATVTVMLRGQDAKLWVAHITRIADAMSASGLVTGNGMPVRRDKNDN